MAKKITALAGRAWINLLRLALLWARKGGAFKRGLMVELHLYLRSLRGGHSDRIHYGEREFSFDETPAFRFKICRPASRRVPCIPCINPPVDFDDDDNNDIFCKRDEETCSFMSEAIEGNCDDLNSENLCEVEEEDGGGIDVKAEEFIARFYEQMKLQRQVSFLQYNEMLHRGMS